MKLLLFLFLSCVSIQAQCEFQVIEFNGLQINATPKEMFVLQENQKTLTGDYVLFSMYTDGKAKHLLVTFSRVAQYEFPEFCLGQDSYIAFSFKDGTAEKVNYTDAATCKQQTQHPKRADFNALKTEFKFELTSTVVTQLKANKVSQLTIFANEQTSFTYDIENKISDKNLGEVSYPVNYFKKTLDCLEF